MTNTEIFINTLRSLTRSGELTWEYAGASYSASFHGWDMVLREGPVSYTLKAFKIGGESAVYYIDDGLAKDIDEFHTKKQQEKAEHLATDFLWELDYMETDDD